MSLIDETPFGSENFVKKPYPGCETKPLTFGRYMVEVGKAYRLLDADEVIDMADSALSPIGIWVPASEFWIGHKYDPKTFWEYRRPLPSTPATYALLQAAWCEAKGVKVGTRVKVGDVPDEAFGHDWRHAQAISGEQADIECIWPHGIQVGAGPYCTLVPFHVLEPLGEEAVEIEVSPQVVGQAIAEMCKHPKKGDLAHVVLNLGETDGICNTCGTKTVLVTTPAMWDAHDGDKFPDWLETNDSLSGHYCPECYRLTEFHFNGKHGDHVQPTDAALFVQVGRWYECNEGNLWKAIYSADQPERGLDVVCVRKDDRLSTVLFRRDGSSREESKVRLMREAQPTEAAGGGEVWKNDGGDLWKVGDGYGHPDNPHWYSGISVERELRHSKPANALMDRIVGLLNGSDAALTALRTQLAERDREIARLQGLLTDISAGCSKALVTLEQLKG